MVGHRAAIVQDLGVPVGPLAILDLALTAEGVDEPGQVIRVAQTLEVDADPTIFTPVLIKMLAQRLEILEHGGEPSC